jgi:Ca-activated chloride channel family protein
MLPRVTGHRRWCALFLAVVLSLPLLLVPGQTRPAAAGPGALQRESVLLIVDFSGSMLRSDGAGSTRIDAAKQAVTALVQALPDDLVVGLRAYGHRVPSSDKAAACQDSELVVPVGRLDRQRLTDTVNGLAALGETPIGLSMQQVPSDLPRSAAGTVIVVSDGADECFPDLGPDPCQVTKDLVASGLDLRVETIGLQVEPAGRSQLECMAAAGGGQFTAVQDTGRLIEALAAARVRGARTFEPRGEPVQAASALIDAPVLGSGTYTDTFLAGESLWFASELERGSEMTARLTVKTAGVPRQARVALEWQDRSARRVDITQLDGIGSGQAETLAVSTGDINGTRTAAGAVREAGQYYLNLRTAGFPEGVEHPFVLELFLDGELAGATGGTLPTDGSTSDPSGSPTDSPTDAPSTSATDGPSDEPTEPVALPEAPSGGGGGGTVVLLLLALLVAGGVGFLYWRRRQQALEGPPPPAY